MTDLLSVADAAGALGVSRWTVYRLIASGDLAHVDLGTAERPYTRIRRADVEALIARRTTRRTA